MPKRHRGITRINRSVTSGRANPAFIPARRLTPSGLAGCDNGLPWQATSPLFQSPLGAPFGPSDRSQWLTAYRSYYAPSANGMVAPSWSGIDVPKWKCCFNHLTKGATDMKLTTIGIDLAKSVFQVHGADFSTVFSVRCQTPSFDPLKHRGDLPG